MSQTQNLSTQNALARLSLGLALTAFGTSRLAKNSDCTRGKLMVLFGAMKAAEGVTKYCPTKALMNSASQNMFGSSSKQASQSSSQNSMTTAMSDMFSGSMQNQQGSSASGMMSSAVNNMFGGSTQNQQGSSSSNMMSNAVNNMLGGSMQNSIPDVAQLMKDFASAGMSAISSSTGTQATNTQTQNGAQTQKTTQTQTNAKTQNNTMQAQNGTTQKQNNGQTQNASSQTQNTTSQTSNAQKSASSTTDRTKKSDPTNNTAHINAAHSGSKTGVSSETPLH